MPKQKVIVNSTPLIALAEINMIHLLKQLYNEIYIPEAVFNEISVKSKSKSYITFITKKIKQIGSKGKIWDK